MKNFYLTSPFQTVISSTKLLMAVKFTNIYRFERHISNVFWGGAQTPKPHTGEAYVPLPRSHFHNPPDYKTRGFDPEQNCFI